MKKAVSIIASLALVLSVFSVNYVFAEEQNAEKTETLEFTQAPGIAEETGVMEEHNSNEEAGAIEEYENYRVVQNGRGDYLAVGITNRDVEVYVTDGHSPIEDAVVELNGQTIISDENGKAEFIGVPSSRQAYSITVSSEIYGQKESVLYICDTEILPPGETELKKYKFNISYWAENLSEFPMTLSESDNENADGEWVQKASASYLNFANNSMLAYNDKLYAVGANELYIYDMQTDVWSFGTSPPGTFGTYDKAVLYDGKIYVSGYGWFGVYNISESEWENAAQPEGYYRTDSAAAAADGYFYLAGGWYYGIDDPSYQNTSCIRYNIASDSWEYIGETSNSTDGDSTWGAAYNGAVYVFDGTGALKLTSIVEYITEFNNYGYGTSACLDEENGKVYFFSEGGTENYVFDFETLTFTQTANSMELLYPYSAAVCCGGNVYVFGSSYYDDSTYLDPDRKLNIYDIESNAWSQGTPPIDSLVAPAAVLYNGGIYALSRYGRLNVYTPQLPDGEIDEIVINSLEVTDENVFVVNNGTLQGKGSNSEGQLCGSGNAFEDELVTIPGTQNLDVKTVKQAAGCTYVITSDYKLYGWGSNKYGQLGTGNKNPVGEPVKILDDVVNVCGGKGHMIALTRDGTVYGCGDNFSGQLGAGDSTAEVLNPIPIFHNAKSINAAAYQTFAINSENELHGTGGYYSRIESSVDSQYYICALGTGAWSHNFTKIMDGIEKVSTSGTGTLALTQNGNVYGWGYKIYTETGESKPYPFLLDNISNNSNITDVKAAYRLYLYQKDGEWYVWGDNTSGKFAQKTVEGICTTPNKIPIAFDEISVNSYVCFGKVSSGEIYEWGRLSQELTSAQNTAFKMFFNKFVYNKKIVQVSAERYGAAALDEEGNVLTWGDGSYWDLGHNSSENVYYPKVVQGINKKIVKVAKGGHITYALDEDGNVWGWGKNAVYGIDKAKVPTIITGVSNVVDISACGTEWYALKSDGTVWKSGRTKIDGMENVSQIACGTDFAIALSGTTAYTWGSNAYGQLGDGTAENRTAPQPIEGSYKRVYANSDHVLAIGADDALYSWGKNSVGQLGLGDKENRSVPTKITAFTQKVIAAGTGASSSMATLEDGTVWGWGEGRNLQLGLNPAGTAWVPKQSAYASNFTYLSGGKDFMVAIDKLGTMYTAGQNDYGQLGQICHEPKNVKDLESSETNRQDLAKQNTPINGTLISEIIYSGQEKWFKLVPKQTAIYDIYSASKVASRAELYNASNTLMGQSFNAWTDIYGNTYNGFRLDKKLIAGQAYYLKVSNLDRTCGTFDINVFEDDYSSAFETVFVGYGLPFSVSGIINNSLDVDIFKFVPSIGGKYIFTAKSDKNIKCIVFNSSKQLLYENSMQNSDICFRIREEFIKDAIYYIALVPLTANDVGEYSLYVEQPFDVVSVTPVTI